MTQKQFRKHPLLTQDIVKNKGLYGSLPTNTVLVKPSFIVDSDVNSTVFLQLKSKRSFIVRNFEEHKFDYSNLNADQ